MNRFYQGDWIDSMASRFIEELPEKYLEKNSFFDEEVNEVEDFDFNQDFEIEEGTRSPGWIRYQKRIKWKKIKILRDKFKKYNIDGYIVPKNDDYFTEYSKINRLKIISNFTGSAGLAVILKNKNYLFTDGRYTIQSQIESGKNFKIISYEKIINCDLFKNLTLGIDPKLFTYDQIKKFFLKKNKIKFIDNNLIDEIEKKKIKDNFPFLFIKQKYCWWKLILQKLIKFQNILKKINLIIYL